MAETGDIIIMNTTGKRDPFNSSQNVPDHIAKAVGKAKNITGSMKSTRSTRSLGGISIFMDPDTAASLPRDLEMTMSMYEVENDPARTNGDAGPSTEFKKETGHVEVNGDIYATVVRTKTKTTTSKKTKDGSMVNGETDDAKSFVFTSELAGENKRNSGSAHGSGQVVQAEGALQTETKGKGKKSAAELEHVTIEREKTTTVVVNSTSGSPFTTEQSRTDSIKESGSKSSERQERGSDKIGSGATGGFEAQPTTTTSTNNNNNTAGPNNKNVATDVNRAGSFQLKSAFSGDTQRMVSASSSSSLHDNEFKNSLSDTLIRKVQKGRIDQQQAPSSVTSSSQSVVGAGVGVAATTTPVATKEDKEKEQRVKTDNKSASVTKRETVVEKTTTTSTTSSGHGGAVTRQKEVNRSSSSSSRPASQSGSRQSLSKNVYGVFGKGAKDASKPVGRASSSSGGGGGTAKSGRITVVSSKRESTQSQSSSSVAASAPTAAAAAAAAGVTRKESTKSGTSSTAANAQQASRSASKASSRAEIRPVSQTPSVTSKSSTTVTTLQHVSSTEESKKDGVEKAASSPVVEPSYGKEDVVQQVSRSSSKASSKIDVQPLSEKSFSKVEVQQSVTEKPSPKAEVRSFTENSGSATTSTSSLHVAETTNSNTSLQASNTPLRSLTTTTTVSRVTEVERASSKASDASSSVRPVSSVSSVTSVSTLQHSDSQRSSVTQANKGKYYKSEPGKSYGSTTSLQRSISQRSDSAKISEPISTSSSISSLARRYSSKENKPGGSSSNVSTVTDFSLSSRADSERTLQESPDVETEATVTTTTTTASRKPEAEKTATPTHGTKEISLKSESMTTTKTTSSDQPSPSILQNKAFKAEISALFAGRPAETTASAPTSLARNKEKKKQQLYSFDSDQDIRLTANYRGLSKASGDPDADTEYDSQTFPRSSDKESKIVSSTPTSPIYEIKQTVQSGTVGKLVKDVFWNLPLTGRSLDATLERKNKAKESKQPGEVSPKAADDETGDGKKKYRFMVEGIDVPAPEKEEEEKTETTQQSSTTAELQADQPDGSTEQAEEPQSGTLKKDFEKKGFSYILDKKLASEIVKRAETVTKKRPHEKVEQKAQVHRQSSMVDYESDLYKDAKAKLHKKETSVEILSDDDDTQHESDFLKEIRSKLNKQRSSEFVVEKEREGQQTSHGQKTNQTEVHASVPAAPVNTEHAFSSKMNAKKTEMKPKDLAKRSIEEPTTNMSRSHAKDAISVERTTVTEKSSPLSPDSAYQSDPNLSPVMGTEIDAQPSTSFDKTAGSKSHKVTLEDLGPEPEDLVVQPLVLTDGSGHNGAATQFESSQQRLVKQTKTVTTTTTSDFESPQGKKQLQETKTDWSAESSTVVKSGGKVHKDSSFKSESKEFRNFVGDDTGSSDQQPSRDSRAIGVEPQPLSQLDIINAALTSQSSSSTTPRYSETVAKSSVADSQGGNEFGATAVTQKESRGERRTKDVETKILIQDSAHYNSSLQADSSSSAKESGRSKKRSKGKRPERVAHSVGKDAPPEIVVDTVETPRDFDNTQFFSPPTSNHYSQSLSHSRRTPGPEPLSASPTASPLNRSYREVSVDQDVYRGQNNNSRHRPGTDSHSHAAKIIQLEPLAVDVNYDSHLEMKTHPSVEDLNDSPLPQRSGRNGAYSVSANSTPYGPLSPQSDASGSVWLNSPYPTMSSTAQQSTYMKEYREVNNNETYRYDVGIENIPSPKKFLKVDELSSGKVPKYASRDIQIHDVTNRQQVTTRSGPYPNGMDSLDSGGFGSNDRRGNYQVQKVMQQRMGREVYSQPIDMHPDMQYKKQKFYSISQDSGGGPSHAGRIPSTSVPGGMSASTGTGTGYSDTLRSVEIDAVDPELENASTDGSNYHITLKLNPHGQGTTSRPASKASYYAGDNFEENRYSSSSQAFLNSPTGPGRPGSGNYPGNQRQIRVLSSSSAGSADYNNQGLQGQGQGQGQGHTHYVMMNVKEGPGFARGGGVQYTGDRVDGYSSGAEMYGTGTSGLSANSTGGPPPRYTMAIDQTMTMDYVPKEHEQPQSQPPPPPLQHDEPGRHKANIYLADSRKVETNTYFEPEPTPLQTSRVYVSGEDEPDGARRTRRHRMTKMSSERTQHDNEDLRQYMSPDEDVDYETDEDDMPQVVRGSILIKNTMDTTGAPKVIDVVEGEDSEEEFVVEDNTNPFHGKYFQLRENPMYNSDPDLSQMRDETDYVYHKKNKPAFTKIFEKKTGRVVNGAPEDEGTEIRVTKESNKGPRKHRTKRTEHHVRSEYMNGHAGEDDEDEMYSEGEYTTRMTTKKTVTTDVPRRGGRGGASSSSRGASGGGGGSGSLSVDMQIARLLQNAPPDSVKQTISVEREEEEIIGPLAESPDDPNGLLNFDTVSEKVDLGLVEGKAQVAVKVRCERIVPIRGVEDMFKKSSVIVTRMIEIDLQATEERRRLYDRIMHGGQQGMITGGEGVKASKRGAKLSSTETFNLYKTFMGLADAEEGRKKERMQVDRKIEEQQAAEVYAQQDIRRADIDDTLPDQDELDYDTDVLDQRLEDEILARKSNKAPDLDTISYMSALSEGSDLLY